MIKPAKIEQLAKQVADNLPPGVRQLGDEVEKQVRQVLQSGLGKLDLVPREEFEVQTQVLLRTRQKLQALEERVAALESHSSQEGKLSATPDGETEAGEADSE